MENVMKKKKIWLIVFILAMVIFIIAVAGIVMSFITSKLPVDEYYATTVATGASTTSPEDALPENPIDFVKLQQTNEDIYAWIRIPNTNVDYPILQSYQEHDNFYIDHNIYKNKDSAGSIYTQKKNNLFFSDPNTLIYGHNKSTGNMFSKLLNFKNEEFFEENRYFYIYTPGRILTYEIFAAYLYDDRHILNSFNFYDDEIFERYLESCLNPKSMIKNVRTGVTLTVKDRIVTLSTCPTWYGKEPQRYLVQGVLIKDEQTR
jgi:sortase B